MTTIRNGAMVLVLAVVSTAGAWAHGEQHGKANEPVRYEQKDWGIAGDAKKVVRTVRVGMSDAMRFSPQTLTVRRGETLRFIVRNDGQQLHEFVIGTPKELEEHAALMLKFPDMQHDEPYMAHVPAGKSAEIVWNFNRAGQFQFACLIAGHFQAGMVGSITVTAR